MRWLLTVTGPDRPGLIAAVSKVLAEEGSDIEDVSMTRLSGNFAMIFLARGGDEARARERLEGIARNLGLAIHFQPSAPAVADAPSNLFVSVIGPNRIGIVATISGVMAAHGANIQEMTTQLLEKTEEPVYFIRIEARVDNNTEALEADLREAARKVGVEIRLEPLEDAEL